MGKVFAMLAIQTWVHILRIHLKLDIVLNVCDPKFLIQTEEKAGALPDTQWTHILPYAVLKESLSSRIGGEY